jgi:hypothetical protein
MGEYALYKGQQIKIGTCETMYYLRADQAHLVTPLPGNVDPIKDADEIRFRFPSPTRTTSSRDSLSPSRSVASGGYAHQLRASSTTRSSFDRTPATW